MIFRLFRKNPRKLLIEGLHCRISEAARDPALYVRCGVPDTLEGRFEMLALHLVLVLRRLRRLPSPAADVAQELIDSFFRQLDASLRELGVGDMGVPKRMKKLAQGFYSRAHSYDSALDAGELATLKRALAEHLERESEALTPLARYALASDAALAAESLERLFEGGPRFPSAASFVEEPAR